MFCHPALVPDTPVQPHPSVNTGRFAKPEVMIATAHKPLFVNSVPNRSPSADQVDNKRRLKAEVALLEERARSAAASGDLDAAGKAVLAALDCERKLAGVGPQVLQLIKPRS